MVLEKFWLESKFPNQLIFLIKIAVTDERNHVNQELVVVMNEINWIKHLFWTSAWAVVLKQIHFFSGINNTLFLIEVEYTFLFECREGILSTPAVSAVIRKRKASKTNSFFSGSFLAYRDSVTFSAHSLYSSHFLKFY